MTTPPGNLPPGPDAGVESPSWRTIEWVATRLVLCSIAGLLALWLPNILRWPMYWDTEGFAQMAREWELGISRPYRDVFSYNWPGQIYLCWAAGKLFGWGTPTAVHLMDVLLLASFMGCVLTWSKRCFGRLLPGAIALLGIVVFYMNCNFQLTGQRTWQSALLAAASIMTAGAFPGLRGGFASGLLLAAGMLFRPEAAVWGGGAALARIFGSYHGEFPLRSAVRSVLVFVIGVATGLLLGFMPLIHHGLMDDFLQGFGMGARGQLYDAEPGPSQTVLAIVRNFPRYECLQPYDVRFFLIGLPGLWAAALWRGNPSARGRLTVWLWTVTVVSITAFNMPFFIGYLVLPIVVAALLSIAPSLAALIDDLRRAPGAAAVLLLLLGLQLMPRLPAYCDAALAWQTTAAVLSGRAAQGVPRFHSATFTGVDGGRKWGDFRACSSYLRHGLPRGFGVVSGLDPFGGYAGLSFGYPSNRRTVAGTSVLLLPSLPTHVFEELLGRVVANPKTALVVTGSQVQIYAAGASSSTAKLDRWQALIARELRSRYQPAARFGDLEVWIHQQEPEPAHVAERTRDVGAR